MYLRDVVVEWHFSLHYHQRLPLASRHFALKGFSRSDYKHPPTVVIFPAKWRKFFTLFGVTFDGFLPLTPRGFSAFTVDLTTTVSRACIAGTAIWHRQIA